MKVTLQAKATNYHFNVNRDNTDYRVVVWMNEKGKFDEVEIYRGDDIIDDDVIQDEIETYLDANWDKLT